ncbi:E3 ubiquitin/ISG15 ligase TRIM25-like [Mugil cephalus]|uniref:E3 ubiquitin/ISG15 ligase TRIM25-like n=1 Tax=Mugil cephalus TaxID=48193 RepID=UPI001FB6D876|nr:E3 ubiquitin/ISG15 ligase TRIM25-like [Mugil cephalus]
MSAVSCPLSEDQFLCSICLEVFTDPVSTPCGHNFCKKCITEHWKTNVQCQCPMCKRAYDTRPELFVNTFISEMVAQFKWSAKHKANTSSSEQQVAKPGEIPCDVCSGTKLKALKSCLVCLASYCESHLEPHQTMSGLKRHQLMDPVEDLEGRMCMKHDKLLELFCKTDQVCVCMLCTVLDHKTHEVVLLKVECEEKKTKLKITEEEIQKMIQKKQVKIQEIKHSVKLSKEDADREIAKGVKVFTALRESVDRSQTELMKTIENKQRTTEKQAEGFIRELEEEISELKKRSFEVEQLSHSDDHLHLIQNFSSMNAAPPTKDWTEASVHQPLYGGTVRRAVTQLEETLSEQTKELLEDELKTVQQYAVDVTLDPDVVHPKPAQSHERGRASEQNRCRCVFSTKGFSSGRFYFEVMVKNWSTCTIGVAKQSKMKEIFRLSPDNGYWTASLKFSRGYVVSANPSFHLYTKLKPEKLAVFVDYEEGLVCFYVADPVALVYSFTGCNFTGKLHPFFSPCSNDGIHLHSADLNCVLQ